MLPATGDAWMVVEAGLHQDTPPDTDGDGLPDLPDADVPGRPASATIRASTCRRSRPASGPRRSATRFSSTSTAAVGRRRACRERHPSRARCRRLPAVFVPRAAAHADLAAEVCPGRFEAAAGPLAGGTQAEQPADFGAVPEACPASDLSLRLRGELARSQRRARLRRATSSPAATARVRRRLNATELDLDGRRPHHLSLRQQRRPGRDRTVVRAGDGRVSPGRWRHRPRAPSRRTPALCCRSTPPARADSRPGSSSAPAGARGSSRRWLVDGGALPGRAAGRHRAARRSGQLEPAALAEVWFAPRPAFALFAGGSLRLEVAPAFDAGRASSPGSGCAPRCAHGLWLAFLAEAPVAGTERTKSWPACSWAGHR